MNRLRRLSIALLLGLLVVATAGVASAAPGDGKGKGPRKEKLRIEWSVRRVVQTVAPGQSVVVPVTLTSNVDLANVMLRPTGGLESVLTLSTKGPLTLKAGVPFTISLTLALPAEGARAHGGVVQVRVGKRNVPASLKVWVAPPGSASDDDSDDDNANAGAAAPDKGKGDDKGKAKGKDS